MIDLKLKTITMYKIDVNFQSLFCKLFQNWTYPPERP